MAQPTQRRHGRASSGAQGLAVGVLLLLLPWAPAVAQRAEPPSEDTAGLVWRLVRGGGGVTSARGTTGVRLQSVASNGDIFVAVGENGTFARSSDGNHWESFSPAPAWLHLADVVWGGGRFVAVGDFTILRSTDGNLWETITYPGHGPWNSVAWGNDRFVAVGDDGAILQSSDGRRWQRARRRATGAALLGVTWGGGRFVAVGNDGSVVYSDDGEHWEKSRDTGISTPLYDVAWSGERYVAVGQGTILHSNNGRFWDAAASSLAPPEQLNDVIWTGHRFVAVGHRILYSGDGDLWQTATAQVGGDTVAASQLVEGRITNWGIYLNGVSRNGAELVAVGAGGAILTSSDGTHWEQASDTGRPFSELQGVAWGGGRFVAVGYSLNAVLHSPDGQHWQKTSGASAPFGLHDVVWAGERFVAVGSTIATSADGNHWQETLASFAGNLSAVAWSGTALVAVGEGGTILRSQDGGERWTTVAASATKEPLSDVVWNGGRFVAVGGNGVIVHSRDGSRWRPARRPAVPVRDAHPDDPDWPLYGFNGVAWNGERFVAVGWGGNDRVGTVAHSRDGDRWELADDHDFLADEHFTAVAWNGARFAAVSSSDGTIMYSADGDRWEPASEIATFDTLNDVAGGNGRFVAVGWNGTIVVSP